MQGTLPGVAQANPYRRSDHFTERARKSGYPARSVFKLADLDGRAHLLRRGMCVLDLGAAPGSWTLYAAERVGAEGRVLAVDLTPIGVDLPANVTAMVGDALELQNDALALHAPYDVVLSDMAPSTTGSKQTDAIRSAALVERAIAVADALAGPGSALVAKLFMGAEYDAIRELLRQRYATLRTLRPDAVRARSVEVFLVATGRKP
jgi:23S rRNA (uridine2552-2'-O)-methyltransferase